MGFSQSIFSVGWGKVLREHNLRGFSALTKAEKKRILSFFLIVYGSPKTRTQPFQVFVKFRLSYFETKGLLNSLKWLSLTNGFFD